MNSENHVKVAIIGAGPSGIGLALGLAKRGVKSVLLIDRNEEIGGIPSVYKKKQGGVRTFINLIRGRVVFGEQYTQWLAGKLAKAEPAIWLKSKVIEVEPSEKRITLINPDQGKVHVTANAVVMACGARENSSIELGWLSGTRTGRTFFSKTLLELMDHHNVLPIKQPVIVGSDLNAYAAAAKLRTMGASNATILDTRSRPKSPLYSRIYFQRWKSYPKYHGKVKSARFIGNGAASAIEVNNSMTIPCDGIVLSGDLIPNSELAMLAHMNVEVHSRKPVVNSDYQLSEPGWFATGNILGGFHSAEWCYLHGKRVAKFVATYLKNNK
ncbi:FAD-dependent oxidoreductase [candidate division KSB1 bacterium]|nr:FAD-dependent oxidoreductase [candidate division KSB1 bacterium]